MPGLNFRVNWSDVNKRIKIVILTFNITMMLGLLLQLASANTVRKWIEINRLAINCSMFRPFIRLVCSLANIWKRIMQVTIHGSVLGLLFQVICCPGNHQWLMIRRLPIYETMLGFLFRLIGNLGRPPTEVKKLWFRRG